MEHYEDNLRHVMRPDERAVRERTPRLALRDYEALFLADILEEFGSYRAKIDQRGIVWGYVEYINMVVREEGRSVVTLFVHTPEAFEVLEEALTTTPAMKETALRRSIRIRVDEVQDEVYA